jgi:hypothetical protein
VTLKLAITLGTLLPLFASDAGKQPVQMTTSERVNFAPGGLIRFNDSYGDLYVEGWDRPEVEIKVTKSTVHYYSPKDREKAAQRLERIHIATQHIPDTELTISTTHLFQGGLFSPPFPPKTRGGVTVEYQIHVPYDTRLVIHHGGGNILVSHVTGDIEATGSRGDIVLMLSDKGKYSIDAKSKIGTVSSDFAGDAHLRKYLLGERYANDDPAPARRIHLRMGFGGITIKAVPPVGY